MPVIDAPVWVQVVVILFGIAGLVAAGWAKFRRKEPLIDRDYRDDL